MQLFISSEYTEQGPYITITEDRIIHQCSRVLRLKNGSLIQLQDNTHRYTLSLISLSKEEIKGKVIEREQLQKEINETTMYIALPNRRDKAELIAQKLTEIGISRLIFFPSHRSLYKTTPPNKQKRITQIAQEAAEQSFRTSLPIITFLDKRDEKSILGQTVIFFHQEGSSYPFAPHKGTQALAGIIGPEGGFTSEEFHYFSSLGETYTIGNTILRMETAAIIGSRLLHQR